ncbi:MAG: gamma-glutamyltransferase family protein, partial [Bacteroidia bacterium]|nr:gamma-glutamyltransferase family protein [Bacteroidia bacterium]
IEEFYSGKTAQLIVDEMNSADGIITAEDLSAYKSVWRETISIDYKGFRIHSMPPPSSGGICILQLLGIISSYNIGTLRWHSEEHIHLITEAERRVYADRAYYLGDPDFVNIPIDEITNKNYLLERMMDFHPKKATESAYLKEGKILDEGEQTTHLSVVDSKGNAVSLTTTLNLAYGSKVFVDDAGFFLNSQMDDFSIKPGVPNEWGLVGAEANAIASQKRMLSSMSPTIVEKNNDLFMLLGSPGGSTIITTIFQCISNVVDFDMTLEEAVQAPRIHHQWLPDKLFYEKSSLTESQLSELRQMGHNLEERSLIGSIQAIIKHENGEYSTSADHRRDAKGSTCAIKIR